MRIGADGQETTGANCVATQPPDEVMRDGVGGNDQRAFVGARGEKGRREQQQREKEAVHGSHYNKRSKGAGRDWRYFFLGGNVNLIIGSSAGGAVLGWGGAETGETGEDAGALTAVMGEGV